MVQEEKSMIKKNKGLFILIGILVVLLAAYFGLQAWNKSQEEKAEQEDEAAVVHVTETDAEDIVSMRFDVGNGEMEFVKEDDHLVLYRGPEFPADTELSGGYGGSHGKCNGGPGTGRRG